MIGYHVTTVKKLARYTAMGTILPPVRFWRHRSSAEQWMRKTGRTIILQIECSVAHPLPDHRPRGHAWWTPELIRAWHPVSDEGSEE